MEARHHETPDLFVKLSEFCKSLIFALFKSGEEVVAARGLASTLGDIGVKGDGILDEDGDGAELVVQFAKEIFQAMVSEPSWPLIFWLMVKVDAWSTAPGHDGDGDGCDGESGDDVCGVVVAGEAGEVLVQRSAAGRWPPPLSGLVGL